MRAHGPRRPTVTTCKRAPGTTCTTTSCAGIRKSRGGEPSCCVPAACARTVAVHGAHKPNPLRPVASSLPQPTLMLPQPTLMLAAVLVTAASSVAVPMAQVRTPPNRPALRSFAPRAAPPAACQGSHAAPLSAGSAGRLGAERGDADAVECAVAGNGSTEEVRQPAPRPRSLPRGSLRVRVRSSPGPPAAGRGDGGGGGGGDGAFGLRRSPAPPSTAP